MTHQPSQSVLAHEFTQQTCPYSFLPSYLLHPPLTVTLPICFILYSLCFSFSSLCCVYRYLLHQDKKREVRRNREQLTTSAQQLRQNIRNNEVAKLAVTAMTTAAKNVKGIHGQGEEAPLEDDSPDQESRTRAQSSDESIGHTILGGHFHQCGRQMAVCLCCCLFSNSWLHIYVCRSIY